MNDIREDEAQQARIEGRHARRDGVSRDDCPYPIGTMVCRMWHLGWTREDDVQERETDDGA